MKSLLWLLTAALLLGLALPALAGTKEGVTMPDDVQINGKKLVLNGMGLRTKTIFNVKVYVAGLYLVSKTQDENKILGTDEEKRLVMHFLHDVDKGKLVDAWKEGFEDNVAEDTAKKLMDRLEKVCAAMVDVKVGDQMVFTYVPKKGLEVSVKGAVKTTIDSWEFASNFFRIWFGPEPPTEDLKKGLLGK